MIKTSGYRSAFITWGLFKVSCPGRRPVPAHAANRLATGRMGGNESQGAAEGPAIFPRFHTKRNV